jgi:septum site-determining protein MinC
MIDFRFNGQELILWIGKDTPKEILLHDVDNRLKNMSTFFSDEEGLSLLFEGGMDQSSLILPVLDLLERKNIKVRTIHFTKPERQLNRQISAELKKTGDSEPEKEEQAVIERKLKLFQTTVRSGQVFEYDGDALIIGSINKGAQVTVTGNLIVIGEIKGNVRVGLYDPEEAFILATSMHPNIMQIGNTFSTSISSDELALCKMKNGRLTLEPITENYSYNN